MLFNSVVYRIWRAGLHCIGLEEQLLGHRRPRLLHAGDDRGGRFCLVPELLELVGLAILVKNRFDAGGRQMMSPPAK